MTAGCVEIALGPAVHGFLDTIREGHPATTLVVVTPILCPIHEDVPGPSAMDVEALRAGTVRFVATGDPAQVAAGKLTLRIVREELAHIVAQRSAEDPHLHLLQGLALYGEADAAELPLPDQLHPDAATHRRIGASAHRRIGASAHRRIGASAHRQTLRRARLRRQRSIPRHALM